MNRVLGLLFLAAALSCLPSCASSKKSAKGVVAVEPKWKTLQTGKASWYGGRWHGRLTANGERYNQNTMTAAHKTLRFGTKVRVTNLWTKKSCIVRVNNRGPYVKGRVIDLSVAAAKEIGSYWSGVVPVKLEVAQ
jgi:rare lipoprotein A